MPHLCGFYPGICLTTKEKNGKTSVRNFHGSRYIPVAVVALLMAALPGTLGPVVGMGRLFIFFSSAYAEGLTQTLVAALSHEVGPGS